MNTVIHSVGLQCLPDFTGELFSCHFQFQANCGCSFPQTVEVQIKKNKYAFVKTNSLPNTVSNQVAAVENRDFSLVSWKKFSVYIDENMVVSMVFYCIMRTVVHTCLIYNIPIRPLIKTKMYRPSATNPAISHFFWTRLKCSTLSHCLFFQAHFRPLSPKINIMTIFITGTNAKSADHVRFPTPHTPFNRQAPQLHPLISSGTDSGSV